MNFSVCIDAVFHGKDFSEGMQTVKAAGFHTFEFWGWWDRDLNRIRQVQVELGLEAATFCTKFVSLVDAPRRPEYLQGLQESIAAAKMLGCRKLISQVGNDLGISRDEQRANLVAGLKACLPLLEKEQITLLIEPLNTLVDHPGYYLSSSDEAFAIVAAVASPQVKVLFDIYHQQIMEGHLIQRITAHIGQIGHFHAAGNPGRHELYRGEINYPEVFAAIHGAGYAGDIGLEYFPADDPAQGLREIKAMQERLHFK